MAKLSLSIHFVFLLLLLCIFIYSCKDQAVTPSVATLQHAQSYADSDPAKALNILDSITEPWVLDQEHYMQYIVADIQVRFRNYKDITSDTLIFTALQYFKEKDNPYYIGLASFYAGAVNFENQVYMSAFTYFQESNDYAKKSGNIRLIGQSAYNVGYVYLGQNVLDSAIVHFQGALREYEKIENTEALQMETLQTMGAVFFRKKDYVSAREVYESGLELAKKMNDSAYISVFILHVGIVYCNLGEYEKSKMYLYKYLDLSKSLDKSSRDYYRISLNLLRVYSQTNQLDSAKYYSEELKREMPKLKSNYSLQYAYGHLAEYCIKVGDFEKAYDYKNLQVEASLKLSESKNVFQLKTVLNKNKLYQKEVDTFKKRAYLAILACLLFGAVVVLLLRNSRQKRKAVDERIRFMLEQAELRREMLNQNNGDSPSS